MGGDGCTSGAIATRVDAAQLIANIDAIFTRGVIGQTLSKQCRR
jgi:hypothetical protein